MKSTTQSILCCALLSQVIRAGTDGKAKRQTATELASPTRLAVQAVVQVETRAGSSAQTSTGEQAPFASVQYRVENGISRITEISKGDRTWQFTPAPLTIEAPQD